MFEFGICKVTDDAWGNTLMTSYGPSKRGMNFATRLSPARLYSLRLFYGLVIDFDNAFSLTEAIEHGYNINSVSNSDDI